MTQSPYIRNQAPEIPGYYVQRPVVGAALKKLLLADSAAERLLVSAVHGLGGIGKTTLVAALCRDPEVQARYPDGILWAVLGQKPDLPAILGNWIRDLGDAFRFTSVEEASVHLGNLLKDRRVLLVVDDAWEQKDLAPFLVGGPDCRIVITTRIADLARACDAHLYNLDLMSRDQALELFQKRLGRLSAPTRSHLMDLSEELGYLPLAIELAAARLHDGADALELLNEFRAGIADLDALNLGEAGRRNESLRVCFRLSLDQLEPELETAFRAFGILPEDARVHPAMCATLWNVSEKTARERLSYYRDQALLKPVSGDDYTIHDLLHDEAGLRLKATGPLSRAHAEFLDRHYAETRDGLWHTLPDDDYIHRYLFHHCMEAGRADLVHMIMSEQTAEGANGWHAVREASGAHAGYMQDLGTAWEIARGERSLTRQIRYALMYASLVSLAHHVAPPLLRELLRRNIWSPGRAIAYARNAPGVLQRLQALAAMARYLPEARHSEVHEEFFMLLGRIHSERERSDALVNIAQSLPSQYRRDYEQATAGIKSPVYRLRAAAALDLMPGETLIHELEEHYERRNDDDLFRGPMEPPARDAFEVHLELLRNGNGYLLQDALEHWRHIKAPMVRARYLIEMRDLLTPEERTALAAELSVSTAPGVEVSPRIRATVARLLAPEERSRLLNEIKANSESLITEDSQRGAEILLNMTAAVAEDDSREWLVQRGLLALQMVESPDGRAMVFNQTAGVLEDPALLRALDLVHEINDGHVVLFTLKDLLPAANNFELLLGAARKPRSAWKRARGLAILVSAAPPGETSRQLSREALGEARRGAISHIQVEIIKNLLPHMDEEVRREALQMARSIDGASHRFAALTEFRHYTWGAAKRELTLECLNILPRVRRLDPVKTWLIDTAEELLRDYRDEMHELTKQVELPGLLLLLFNLLHEQTETTPEPILVERLCRAFAQDPGAFHSGFDLEFLEKHMTPRQLIDHWLIRGTSRAVHESPLSDFSDGETVEFMPPEKIKTLFELLLQLPRPEERLIIATALAPVLDIDQVARVYEDVRALFPRYVDLSLLLPIIGKLSSEDALDLLDRCMGSDYEGELYVLMALIPRIGHALGPERLGLLRRMADRLEERYEKVELLECIAPFLEPEELSDLLDYSGRRLDDEDLSHHHLRLSIALRPDALDLPTLREMLRVHPDDLSVRAALLIRAPREELSALMPTTGDERKRMLFRYAMMSALPHASPERFFAILEIVPDEEDGDPPSIILTEIDMGKRLFYANYGKVDKEVMNRYLTVLAGAMDSVHPRELAEFTDEITDPERRRKLTGLLEARTLANTRQEEADEDEEFPNIDFQPVPRTPHPAFRDNFSAAQYEDWCRALNELAGRSRPYLLKALSELIAECDTQEREEIAHDILRIQRWWP